MTKQKKTLAVILTAVWIIILIPVYICMIEIGKKEIKYELEYYANPFEVETITILNKGSAWQGYEAFEDEAVYEVRLTLKNVGVRAANPKTFLTMEGLRNDGESQHLYSPIVENWSDVAYEDESTWTIPPGKTGEYVYYVVAGKAVYQIRVSEKGEKLAGEAQSWDIPLPKGDESAQTLNLV